MKFSGMTLNERLFAIGALDTFAEAVKNRDREELVKILRDVEVGDQAEQIITKILQDPKKYGFDK